ncbi:unnamed protein product [Moneuplotes crassus]|uniref:Uncharacterized protein n=1 Tax=Euplotes crassus TaxID=5936 RepID=A0AAD1XFC1_EUPCR|nr:unnamed protein product [Moneuplotes crassus]
MDLNCEWDNMCAKENRRSACDSSLENSKCSVRKDKILAFRSLNYQKSANLIKSASVHAINILINKSCPRKSPA